MKIGQVRYGLICEADGGVIDDVLVSREGEEAFHVVVNASNRDQVVARWQSALSGRLRTGRSHPRAGDDRRQGPEAANILAG